ncbi:MAG: hypothetical protein MUF08_05725, partial [Burkholderiaceae bacterium]|nr:hypothetical protein [Burkholderiaceae bacterium]
MDLLSRGRAGRAVRHLRSAREYFLLAAAAPKLHLLSWGPAVILVFIVTKTMLIDLIKVPEGVSL